MYDLLFTSHFAKQLKPYIKKHPSLKADLLHTLTFFEPKASVQLSARVFKVRIGSSDLKKGKRSSFRVIVILAHIKKILVPVTVFAKNDKNNISRKEIALHIKKIKQEIGEPDEL